MDHEHGPLVSLYARHGSTTLNAMGCYRGPMDPSLDAQGIMDAHRLADFLKDYDLYPVVILSDMKRARETAHIVAAACQGLQCHETPQLRPLNVGDLAGQKRTPENEATVRYHADHPDVPFHNGECINGFRERVHPIMAHGVEVAIKSGKPVLFVAHSSTVHEVGNVSHKDHTASLVKPGGVVAVYICDGCLCSEPIYKPDTTRLPSKQLVS